MKVGTFKVIKEGKKIGERFLKIIFDNALKTKPAEIYVTFFEKEKTKQLKKLFEDWGFEKYGTKNYYGKNEVVYVKKLNNYK